MRPILTTVSVLADRYGGANIVIDFERGVYRKDGVTYGSLTAFMGAGHFNHTRASGALVPVPDGAVTAFATDVPAVTTRGMLVEGAASNLLTYSQQFDNAAWAKSVATATADQTTAPDGTTTADSVADSATTTAAHLVQQQKTVSAGATMTAAVFGKADLRPFIQVALDTSDANGAYANFDLVNGTIVASAAAGTGTLLGSTILALASGWYWCTITGIGAPAGTNGRMFVNVLRAGNGSAGFGGGGVGNVGAGVFLWQADFKAESAPSSPILTVAAGASRAAVVSSVPIPAGMSTYTLAYEGGIATGSVTPGVNLNIGSSSGGAWVGKSIRYLLIK